MNEPRRDPELDWIRSEWQSAHLPPSADAAVLAAYRRRFPAARQVRRLWLPLAAAAFVTLVAVALVRVRPAEPEYRPVAQPRIVVLSQGERP
jgi:hypothetical protein